MAPKSFTQLPYLLWKCPRLPNGSFAQIVCNEPLSVNYEMAPLFAAARKTASCRVLRPAGAYTVFGQPAKSFVFIHQVTAFFYTKLPHGHRHVQ